MDTPSKSINLSIFGNTYACNFPKTGEFIDIQILKSKLTEGYLDTFQSLQREGLLAGIFVDTIATFNVLIPKLQKDLNVGGLLALELDKLIELAYVYKDTYLPWYESWMDILTAPKIDSDQPSKEQVSNG